MTRRCAASGCHNSTYNCPGIWIASFPRDQIRCEAWCKAIGCPDLLGRSISTSIGVCEFHFDINQWMYISRDVDPPVYYKKSGLKHDAMPTILKPDFKPNISRLLPKEPKTTHYKLARNTNGSTGTVATANNLGITGGMEIVDNKCMDTGREYATNSSTRNMGMLSVFDQPSLTPGPLVYPVAMYHLPLFHVNKPSTNETKTNANVNLNATAKRSPVVRLKSRAKSSKPESIITKTAVCNSKTVVKQNMHLTTAKPTAKPEFMKFGTVGVNNSDTIAKLNTGISPAKPECSKRPIEIDNSDAAAKPTSIIRLKSLEAFDRQMKHFRHDDNVIPSKTSFQLYYPL